MMDEIVEFMNTEPAVNFRYYFAPQVPLLPAYEILEFGYENWTKPMIELGQKEALKVIAQGPGKSYEFLHAQHKEMKAQRGI